MKYLFSYMLLAYAFVVPSTQAEAQLFGSHTEMQWLEGEVSLADPLDIIEGGANLDGIEAADLSLTYVYAKAHANVHIVGSVRYLHPLNDNEHTESHKGVGAGIRLYKWGGYAQGMISRINDEWDAVVSAGYYVTPRVGIRANWYAETEWCNDPSSVNELGRVSAGLVWRF